MQSNAVSEQNRRTAAEINMHSRDANKANKMELSALDDTMRPSTRPTLHRDIVELAPATTHGYTCRAQNVCLKYYAMPKLLRQVNIPIKKPRIIILSGPCKSLPMQSK